MSSRGRDADLYLYDEGAASPHQDHPDATTPTTSEATGKSLEEPSAVQTPTPAPQTPTVTALAPVEGFKQSPPPPRQKQQEPQQHVIQKTAAVADVENHQHHTIAQKKEAHNHTPTYPIVNGKRDYSKSLAQLAHPDKIFDSNVTICYRDVSVKVRVPKENKVQHLLSPVVSLWDAATTYGESCRGKDLYRIKDISGIIRPSTMTLVLSGPGEGKSTYLRALANRIPLSAGKVVYNGRNFDQANKEGCDLRTMTQYVDQVSTHLPLLTVYETLNFAHQMTSVKYDPQRVEDAITLLGLEECRDTILGSALIRGVSGGQRQRVTTGELLCSDASVLFLDEYSNGLDSSTAEDIGCGLRRFTQKYNSSIVATLQQPTPELFALFDRIIVLREGQAVFDGPVDDVLPFFAGMGFHCPDDVDTADFLVDCLSQPRSVILRQKEQDLHIQKKSGNNKKITNKPQSITTTYGQIDVSPQPCITTEEMIEYYQTTPQWLEIKEELDRDLPPANSSNSTEKLSPEEQAKFQPLMPTDLAKDMYKLGYRLPLLVMLQYVVQRQAKNFIRNTTTLIPRIIMAIFMSLLYGLLYFRVKDDDYILRLASMVIAVTQVCFGNFIEIPISAAASRVVKKQLAARFYPSWTYVIGTLVMSIPMSCLEGGIYAIILYWMTNCYPAAAEFFIFYAILVAASLMLSCWFRFLAAIGGDEQTSQSLAGPSTGVFTVFGGLFISRSAIPRGMIWLYWISPFSWLVRAMCNNEFLSARYDAIVSNVDGNSRVGNTYLETVDMFIGTEWIGYCFIFLGGMSIFICALNSWLLRVRYYEESIGTRRSDDAEIVEGDLDMEGHGVDDALHDDELLKQQAQAAAVQQAQIQREGSRSTAGSTTTGASSTRGSTVASSGVQSSYNPNALKTLRENLPFTPAWLSFSDVSYTVQVQKDKQTVDRILLNHINGYAQPGKMLALMGASGAGKTTLLDVIAGLKNTGQVAGNILINGQAANKELISSMTGYVEQFDTLFPFCTVYETLLFAARLRLPRAISDTIKKTIVDEIIDILDLGSIKNFIIGNAKIQGLSPSQCKKTNIGVELVANPSILFLDEPTTGLDSKNAMTVMKVVKRIARSGRAIICTIHQPSAELFFLFDRLLLLGAGGYQIYFGDLGRRAQSFVKYLSRCPGITPIKPRVNPASWMLVELGVGVAAEKGDDAARFDNVQANADQIQIEDEPEWAELPQAQRTVQKFRKMYLLSDQFKMAQKRIAVLESIEVIDANDEAALTQYQQQQQVELQKVKQQPPQGGSSVAAASPKSTMVENSANTSKTTLPTTTITIVSAEREGLWLQFKYLYQRNFMAYWRNGSFIYARFSVILILSLLFGLIYLDLNPSNISSVSSLIGACFMGTIFCAVTFSSTCLPNLLNLRPTFYREQAGNYYKPLFWAICQLAIEMFPFIPIGVAIAQIPIYFMVGLEKDVGVFFQYSLATFLLISVYVSVAMTLASVAPSSAAAGILQGAYMSFQSAVSGIAITRPKVPRGFLWLYYLLPGSHLFQALIMPQFKNRTTEITYPKGTETVTTSIRDYVADYLGWGYDDYWPSLGWALLFFCGLQIIAFIATTFLRFVKR